MKWLVSVVKAVVRETREKRVWLNMYAGIFVLFQKLAGKHHVMMSNVLGIL